jgi:hypothetical protein
MKMYWIYANLVLFVGVVFLYEWRPITLGGDDDNDDDGDDNDDSWN